MMRAEFQENYLLYLDLDPTAMRDPLGQGSWSTSKTKSRYVRAKLALHEISIRDSDVKEYISMKTENRGFRSLRIYR